jgi:ubiquinone/menaquinone biosynthesis C-methylase UbiE
MWLKKNASMNRITVLFKDEFQNLNKTQAEIPCFLNEKYLTGDNRKYMKMYNWMSKGYDMVETVVGRLKYGNQVNEMRRETMNKLEWKNNLSVLYVSIGTGKNLEFIPANINLASLNIFGADISLGMLKKCKKKYADKLNLTLVNCCAEDLPFKDNSFDIVFHVGGINFFNDKKKAINEMIRVAKNGTKLLIADETNDLIEKQYKKSSFSKKYFKDATVDLTAIVNLIPDTDRTVDILWDGKFYCITFKK